MNTSSTGEIAHELKKYPEIFHDLNVTYAHVGYSIDNIYGYRDMGRIFVWGDGVTIKNERVDQRRRKLFKYINYNNVADLVKDLIEYQKINMSRKYYRRTALHTIINKWSNSKIHDCIEEMHMGKIVDTF